MTIFQSLEKVVNIDLIEEQYHFSLDIVKDYSPIVEHYFAMNFIDTYFTHDVIDNFDCSFNEIILVHID